jgi:hypothetical protein
MTKIYYLAGRMSGLPEYNHPEFRRVTALLRDQGYNILSPVEIDSPEMQAEVLAEKTGEGVIEAQLKGTFTIAGETWGEVLARDVRIVADVVDGIIFLPGWSEGRGSRLEAFVGVLCDKEFYIWDEEGQGIIPVSSHYIQERLL